MPKTANNRKSQKTSRKPSATTSRNNTKLKDLQSKPDVYIECRSYTYHAFKMTSLFYWRDAWGRGVCRVSVCLRGCGVSREDYYDSKGVRVDRRYNHPDDYTLVGEGKVTNADAVAEYLKRATEIYDDADSVPTPASPLRLLRQA